MLIRRIFNKAKKVIAGIKKEEKLRQPAITNAINIVQYGFSGNYSSWQEAHKHTTGYNAENILHKVKQATLKVKNGEAAYERDSLVSNSLQHHWPLLACMQTAAIENNLKLSVLDFGGSLGSNYNYIKKAIPLAIDLNWSIIEQEHFVKCGKEFFETDKLRFFYTVNEMAAAMGTPNIVLLSSVLQYLPNYTKLIDELNQLKADYILITRTAYVTNDIGFWTVQRVPPSIYEASYPAYFFNEKEFESRFPDYEKVCSFDDPFTQPTTINGKNVYWGGELYKLKHGN